MPTTSSSGLRYPASSAAPNVPADIQNLATDLDTKVVVQVANTTARNALVKYDGMLVYEISSKRHFRWNTTNSRWDYVAGPWYSWTPTLIDNGGSAVTGTSAVSGTYVIADGRFRYNVEMKFGSSIDGRSGQLRLQIPAGITLTSTTATTASAGTCRLYSPVGALMFSGVVLAVPGATTLQPYFTQSSTLTYLNPFVNATSAGATGTGTPLVSGSYPLNTGSEFSAWGDVAVQSWPAL